jgi:hypothetical protein
MRVATAVTDSVTRRLPKFVSPKQHAIADCLFAGTFLLAGALYWRRNRRASISALACGGAELANILLTNYPGERGKALGFPLHGRIDFGVAAMSALMPEFMSFNHDPRKKFFLRQSVLITAITNLTNFGSARAGRRYGFKQRGRAVTAA